MKGFKENFNYFLQNGGAFRDSRYYLNETSQEKIRSLQKEKKLLIEQMHNLLQRVDRGEDVFFKESEGEIRNIAFKNEKLFVENQDGTHDAVSKGDIMVAGMNNFNLHLHAEVERNIKKEFILFETKRKLKKLYDEQLLIAELENKNIRNADLSIRSYEKIKETKEKNLYEKPEEVQNGVVAEVMIESYLTKLFIDNPELPFTIEGADVYEDVRSKIDFKIHIKKEYTRGVGVEIGRNTGIQLTLDKESAYHKKQQIKKSKQFMEKLDKKPVDDLILVTMPIGEIKKAIREWKKEGKDRKIAGPAEHWNDSIKKIIFVKMLETLPPSLNINPEKLWNTIY